MKKTLAQLKRDAKSGNLYAKLIIRNGCDNIPESLAGVRPIVDSNSCGIFIMTANGKKSELAIKYSSLLEYSDEHIIIYNPGLRDLTEDEMRVMNKWKSPETIDRSYWAEKAFYCVEGYEYLMGNEFHKGKKFDYNSGKVLDCSIKGSISMKYELVKNI